MVLPLTLAAVVAPEQLQVVVANPTSAPVRLWSRRCSWGYSAYSLLITPESRPGDERELSVKPVRWTVNIPQPITLEAGARVTLDLDAGDAGWLGAVALEEWRAETWQVRVRLRMPDTPEAREFGVLVGEALSPPVASRPPHAWLFGGGAS